MLAKTTLVAAFLLLPGLLIAGASVSAPPAPPATADPDCHTCSDHAHAIGTLTRTEFRALVAAYAAEPADAPSRALETLLFYGAQTKALLASAGDGLDLRRRAFLERELARTHARLSVRVIDARGVERVRLDKRVPLGIKQHLHGTTNGLPSPEISGTVRRVGLRHLWGRL